MADRVNRQDIMAKLRKAGLWEQADQFREEQRVRLRGEGKSKQVAVAEAWDAMTAK